MKISIRTSPEIGIEQDRTPSLSRTATAIMSVAIKQMRWARSVNHSTLR